MAIIQVDLIRRRVLRAMREVQIFISCLPERENVALERMHGQEGVERTARIADYVLSELGHEVTLPLEARYSETRRTVNALRGSRSRIGELKGEVRERAPKKRGRPAKVALQTESA